MSVTTQVPAGELRMALANATLGASQEPSRPVLTHVHVVHRKGRLVFEATDSYTLIEDSCETDTTGTVDTMVPAADLKPVIASLKLSKEAQSTVHIDDDNAMSVTVGSTTFTLRRTAECGDGTFPNTAPLWKDHQKERSDANLGFAAPILANLCKVDDGGRPANRVLKLHTNGLGPTSITWPHRPSLRALIMPVRLG